MAIKTIQVFGVCEAFPDVNLRGNDELRHCLAIVLAQTPDALEQVQTYAGGRFDYQKWEGASNVYKRRFIDASSKIIKHLNLVIAVVSASEAFIKDAGWNVWCNRVSRPTSRAEVTQEGREQFPVTMSRTRGNTTKIVTRTFLKDEMAMLAHYGGAISFLSELLSVLHKRTRNDRADYRVQVAWDKMYADPEPYPKASPLRLIVQRISKGTVELMGVTRNDDPLPRNLLVDNIAGLSFRLFEKPTDSVSKFFVDSNLYKKINWRHLP